MASTGIFRKVVIVDLFMISPGYQKPDLVVLTQ